MTARTLVGVLVLLAAAGGCRRTAEKKEGLETQQTRSPAEWLSREPVRLLYDYVRLDTTREQGEEQGALFLERFLECAGIETRIVCPVPKRCNLFARLPGRSHDGALLLLNHIDVAPVYPTLWKEGTPFEGRIKNGYLYGRGAYDMKSIGLAQALAMRNLKANGITPRSDVLFLAEADEESEHRWGSRWLLEHHPEWFAGVAAVLNEGGTNEMILRGIRFWGIETMIAGYGAIEFESSSSEAIQGLADRWKTIRSPVVEPLPDVVRGFDMLANHLVHPLTDPLRHLDRVRRHPEELAALPDRYAAFLEARIKWFGPYSGGPPNAFRGSVVVSTPPGMPPEPYLAPIEADAVGAGMRITWRQSSGATGSSPYQDAAGRLVPLLSMIKRVTEARYPGVPFGPVPTFAGMTSSNYFRQRGIPAYGYSPVPANITDAARRHGNNERIFLPDYVEGVRTFSEVVLEFAFADDN